MNFKDHCELCEESGVIFREDTGVDYCSCDFGWQKEFADRKSMIIQKFTTI